MANRKSIQENIQRISSQIADFNGELMKKNPIVLLDIDLLRKYTIDLYDEVNKLRLAMNETIDHGRGDEETRGRGDEEIKEKVDEEMRKDEEMRGENEDKTDVVRHLSGEPVLSQSKESTTEPEPEPSPEENLEALTKAENQVEAEAEVEAMVEAIVEEDLPNEESLNPEPETLNPLPAEASAKEGEIKLAAAEAKIEADAIKAALNPEEANDLAYKFSNTPIHDLKKAISIAKKFEFINSLFGGNVEKYAYSIHHINNLNSGDEAFSYLHDLRTEWKWDDEDKNFQELANLVRRRYLG